MKRMIWLGFIILLCCTFVIKVDALITNDSIAAVANSGKLSEEYKNIHKEFKSVVFSARSNSDNGGEITMTVVREEFDSYGESKGEFTRTVSLNYNYDSEKKIYIASQVFNTEDSNDENYFLYKELYGMFPFWAIEASDRWAKEIEPIFDKNEKMLIQLQSIIDRCYMSEYGVCFTKETSTGQKNSTYIAKAEVSEKTADYVIKQLQANRRERKNKALMKKMVLVFFVLLILYIICSSYRKDAEREEYAKKRKDYKDIQIK